MKPAGRRFVAARRNGWTGFADTQMNNLRARVKNFLACEEQASQKFSHIPPRAESSWKRRGTL